MGEASRRRHRASIGVAPAPVDAQMIITRRAPRFGKARLGFSLGGFSTREAYDALCAIKRAFERSHGFAERPDILAPLPATVAAVADGGSAAAPDTVAAVADGGHTPAPAPVAAPDGGAAS